MSILALVAVQFRQLAPKLALALRDRLCAVAQVLLQHLELVVGLGVVLWFFRLSLEDPFRHC